MRLDPEAARPSPRRPGRPSARGSRRRGRPGAAPSARPRSRDVALPLCRRHVLEQDGLEALVAVDHEGGQPGVELRAGRPAPRRGRTARARGPGRTPRPRALRAPTRARSPACRRSSRCLRAGTRARAGSSSRENVGSSQRARRPWRSHACKRSAGRCERSAPLVAAVAGLRPGASAVAGSSARSRADPGFKPQPDGFAVENYGKRGRPIRRRCRRSSGRMVCAAGTGANCTLHRRRRPGWRSEQVDAGRPLLRLTSPRSSSSTGKRRRSRPVRRGATSASRTHASSRTTIAYAWVHQTLDSVNQAASTAIREQIVYASMAALKAKRELYTIAFFMRDGNGGHAVTRCGRAPRRRQRRDPDLRQQLRRATTRASSSTAASNTWTYNAATNPHEASEQYDGDAQTQSHVPLPDVPRRSACRTARSAAAPTATAQRRRCTADATTRTS